MYLGTSKLQNLPRLQRAFLELKRPPFYGSVPGLLLFSTITLVPLSQPNFFFSVCGYENKRLWCYIK